MATDIAFALGTLALLGEKVPSGLKIFLAALASADDIGAVLVIALFYTSELSFTMLLFGGGFILLLLAANRLNLRSTAVFTILGIVLWICFLKSGIHATFAGVLLAMTIPVSKKIHTDQFIDESSAAMEELKRSTDPKNSSELIHTIASLSEEVQSPLHRFEHALHPFVSFLIMPMFAIANAGVKIEGYVIDALLSPVGLGVAIGFIAGKQIGIFSFVWIAVQTKAAALPENVTWGMIYGTTWLCAIGFTMALFIAGLAFTTSEPLILSKIAILFASALSAVTGLLILSRIKYRATE